MKPWLAPHQVADALGISVYTVKTHLRHIFKKTYTTRQADVVALMSRAAGPTKTGELARRRS